MPSPNTDKLAILIDADNAQAAVINDLLREVARYGTATIKRAYGDWTTPNLNGWRETLHTLAIQPIQQFRFASGKNATDAALIIDAMDLLHGGKVDGFCLVSSDSDFTRLATRVREAGLAVYGFGEKKTPSAFVAACDKFIYTEILRAPVAEPAAIEAASFAAMRQSAVVRLIKTHRRCPDAVRPAGLFARAQQNCFGHRPTKPRPRRIVRIATIRSSAANSLRSSRRGIYLFAPEADCGAQAEPVCQSPDCASSTACCVHASTWK